MLISLCALNMKLLDVKASPRATAATAFACINRAPTEASPVLHLLERQGVPLPRSQCLCNHCSSREAHNGPRPLWSTPLPLWSWGWIRSSEAVLGKPVLKSHQDQAGTAHLLCIQTLLKFCLGIRNVSSSFFISLRYQNSLITCCLQSTASKFKLLNRQDFKLSQSCQAFQPLLT